MIFSIIQNNLKKRKKPGQ